MDWQPLDDDNTDLVGLRPKQLTLTTTVCAVAPLADHTASLMPGEREDVDAMAPARRISFSTGRRCARHALDTLGVAHTGISRAGRVPTWPKGVAGSITHSRDFAAAVATRDYAGIGIDLEQRGRVSEALHERLFVAEERRALANDDEATLLFSAKEAGYKATYPIAGDYIGFQEARVELTGDGEFELRYLGSHTRSHAMDRGRGYWWRHGDHIVTLFVIGQD